MGWGDKCWPRLARGWVAQLGNNATWPMRQLCTISDAYCLFMLAACRHGPARRMLGAACAAGGSSSSSSSRMHRLAACRWAHACMQYDRAHAPFAQLTFLPG